MILNFKSPTWCWVLAGLGICLGPLAVSAEANPDQDGNILVYLEVPDQLEATTSLALGSMTLQGDGVSLNIPVQNLVLSAEELAGNQKLLGIVKAPAGHLNEIQLTIGQVKGTAGIAPIQTDLEGKGFTFAIDFTTGLNRNQCLFLIWHPQSLPKNMENFTPSLVQRHGLWPPLGSALFATCPSSDAILVVDIDHRRVEGSLQVGEDPRGMVYSPRNQKIYAVLNGDDGIAVIQATSCRWEQTIGLNFGDEPTRVLLAENQTDLLVLNSGSRTLVGVSTFSHQEIFRTSVGSRPHSLAQDPVTGLIYVTCEGDGEIQVIDPTLSRQHGAVNLTTSPAEIIIDPRSRLLVVSSTAQRSLNGWNLASGTTSPQLSLCGNASGLLFDHRTNQVYCSIGVCRSISVFQPETGLEFSGIQLPYAPGLMTFGPQFGILAVAFPDAGRMALLRIISGELLQEFETGPDVYDVLIP